MNIINIALKEIKLTFRDVRTLGFMLAFPVVLMLVLGTALTNAFNSKITIDSIHVLYKDQANNELSQYFHAFEKEAGKSGLHFKKASGNTDGKREVKQSNYDGYVEVSNNGIKLYESNRNSIEGNIIQGALTAFVDKYNIAVVVEKVDPSQVSKVLSSTNLNQYIEETSLKAAKAPGSMDYYAVAMSTMIALYGAMGATSLMRSERSRKTADRLLASPVGKADIFIGKVFGSIVVNILCLMIVVLFSKFVFKANWGDHLGVICLILLTEVLLAVSFGLGVSYITKTGGAARTIVMIVVQIASAIGGAYYKIENAGLIEKLSPLTWANQAITKIIYANDVGAALPAIGLNLGITIIMMLIAVVAFQRREGI